MLCVSSIMQSRHTFYKHNENTIHIYVYGLGTCLYISIQWQAFIWSSLFTASAYRPLKGDGLTVGEGQTYSEGLFWLLQLSSKNYSFPFSFNTVWLFEAGKVFWNPEIRIHNWPLNYMKIFVIVLIVRSENDMIMNDKDLNTFQEKLTNCQVIVEWA